MNGSLEHYTRDELLCHLADWNVELSHNNAMVLCSVERAEGLPDDALRDVVIGTANHLGRVVRAAGEQ